VKPDLGPAVIVEPVTRPPLAGPYAFSRIPTPVRDKPHVFLMHDIASTWLFTNLSSGYGDVFNAQIKHTLLSYLAQIFWLSEIYFLSS
jgi:CD109 antigen